MTVQELIKELEKLNKDSEILVNGSGIEFEGIHNVCQDGEEVLIETF